MNYIYIVLVIAIVICLVLLAKKIISLNNNSKVLKNDVAILKNNIETINEKNNKLSKTKESIKYLVTALTITSFVKQLVVEHKIDNKKKLVKTTANLAYKKIKNYK